MKHLLAGKLRYLEDEDVAKAIVDGTYDTIYHQNLMRPRNIYCRK